jgi:hypothetical protein
MQSEARPFPADLLAHQSALRTSDQQEGEIGLEQFDGDASSDFRGKRYRGEQPGSINNFKRI